MLPPAACSAWCSVGQVLLKIVYRLTCRILGLVVLLFRGDGATEAELLALRHENAVLRRAASAYPTPTPSFTNKPGCKNRA